MPDEGIARFVQYTAGVPGDERSDAQSFLERMFQAFGHPGTNEAGAVFETRVRGRNGTVCFADLVWQPRVLIEMKRRGEQLGKHYQQMLDYWTQLTPKPKYSILCNFDEFWIYDFNLQMAEPIDVVKTNELGSRVEAMSFFYPEERTPLFLSNHIDVTKKAAGLVGGIYKRMVDRGLEQRASQRFVLQCLFALFAEGIDLLEHKPLSRILVEAGSKPSPSDFVYDQMHGLFSQMNTEAPAQGGSFRDVKYFNGGLFTDPTPNMMTQEEIELLRSASLEDWSKVNPGIFGTIFQTSMAKGERHARGAHFTSEEDIMKVVMPTILRPWLDRFQKARTLRELRDILNDLTEFSVLDPACGSGNFLYVAYREMKRFETSVILAIRRDFSSSQQVRGYLSLKQFYGFDILPFPVELAKVTLMLAKELALVESKKRILADGGEHGLDFDHALPLENLDRNIIQADALFVEWPRVKAIIGNPPFQSKNKVQKEFGIDYLHDLRTRFPTISGKADYCVYFFRKAHDHLAPGQRAGLVGTNTIRQNESRKSGLEYIVKNGGTITEAISTQVWSGDAVVHVSIVNWIHGKVEGPKRLFWQHESGDWFQDTFDEINPSLSPFAAVHTAKRLSANRGEVFCRQGQTHGHAGFLLPRAEAEALIASDPNYAGVLFPFLLWNDLLSTRGTPIKRFVIDFHRLDTAAASRFLPLFSRIERLVLPLRKRKAAAQEASNAALQAKNPRARVNRHHIGFLARWWMMSFPRPELMTKLEGKTRYIVGGQLSKRPIYEFIDPSLHPNASLMVFPFDDDYSFGIIQSTFHWLWFQEKGSTMKADPRYTSESVFETFPWPQAPTPAQIRKVALAARELRRVRNEAKARGNTSLRNLYRLLELPGNNPLRDVQRALDTAVAQAYGMTVVQSRNPLPFLLALNLRCAAQEATGDEITGPGVPPEFRDLASLLTNDSVGI